MQSKKIGVLLINLGTPNSFRKKDVRKYLAEFLWDNRVIDIPWFFRLLLLYLIILPFRTKKSAKAYESIWLKEGSPLLVHSRNLTQQVSSILGDDFCVELSMRYQNPSLTQGLENLKKKDIDKIIVFPLFPQYASAATGSALEKVYLLLAKAWNVFPIYVIPAFYQHPLFIQCFSNRIKEKLQSFKADYVLFSYHGLPERHILKSQCGQEEVCLKKENCCSKIGLANAFCYRAQCFATTQALLKNTPELAHLPFSNSFQSRLGRSKWIEPYTDFVLPQLAQNGYKKLAIVCPAFVADCLETLEEIEIRAHEQWLSLGGEDLVLVPSLNAQDDWALAVANMIREVSYKAIQ